MDSKGLREMHELVARIKQPELCYIFAKNATERGQPELALQAYRHAVDLRAADHEVQSEAELMAVKAFYAYEEALSWQSGKRKRATGTWQMVNRIGILPALQKRLSSKSAKAAQDALKQMKMEDYSLQAVATAFAADLMQAA
ncbi:hypothetical protein EYC98_11920 [Halieaceae bacterium IMCC14734]|uniref:Uncharacterized protein n=1 Tax=Candidatus Litorirhabdus singularis TaxID=2518993 RepID=A0ABT3TJI1_9GAMM|nr:hypothetical protein [Candidatus Litorirhabdus singularis]MCX2981569.1 hypothetical protein [Candidatus Litorirhabdus singularis]